MTQVSVVPGLKLNGGVGWVRVSQGVTLDAQISWRKWPFWGGAKIIYSGDHIANLVLTMHHVRALGFWIMPEALGPEVIEITLPTGEAFTRTVDGNDGPAFFGLTGNHLSAARISDLAGGGFAIGSFSVVAQDRSRVDLLPEYFRTRDPLASSCTDIPETNGDGTISYLNANLISNAFTWQISGSTGWTFYTGTSLLSVDDTSGGFVSYNNNQMVGNGTYTVGFNRPAIPAEAYDVVQAYWDDPGITAECSFPSDWYVVGPARHSVYDTPHEQQCEESTPGDATAFLMSYTLKRSNGNTVCASATYTQTTLNSIFMQQVTLNGTGIPTSGGPYIKGVLPTSGSRCLPVFPPPPGAVASGGSDNNVFVAVSDNTGACNIVMQDGMVAARPVVGHPVHDNIKDPKAVANCQDNILAVDGNNNNAFGSNPTKTIVDICPACTDPIQKHGPAIYSHFDNYSSEVACMAHNNQDLSGSPFWSADIGAENR